MMNNLLYSDGIEFVFAILTIIWLILSLILFFKVWGMTNDVKKIKDMLSIQFGFEETEKEENKPSYENKSKVATQPKKKTNKSKDPETDPLMSFYDECRTLFNSCKSEDEFKEKVDAIIENYSKTKGVDYGYLKDGLWIQLKQL